MIASLRMMATGRPRLVAVRHGSGHAVRRSLMQTRSFAVSRKRSHRSSTADGPAGLMQYFVAAYVIDDSHPVAAAPFDSIPQLAAAAGLAIRQSPVLPASADGSFLRLSSHGGGTANPHNSLPRRCQRRAQPRNGRHCWGELPESVLAFSGTTLAGCIAVPLHADLHEDDLLPMLKDVDAQILVVVPRKHSSSTQLQTRCKACAVLSSARRDPRPCSTETSL